MSNSRKKTYQNKIDQFFTIWKLSTEILTENIKTVPLEAKDFNNEKTKNSRIFFQVWKLIPSRIRMDGKLKRLVLNALLRIENCQLKRWEKSTRGPWTKVSSNSRQKFLAVVSSWNSDTDKRDIFSFSALFQCENYRSKPWQTKSRYSFQRNLRNSMLLTPKTGFRLGRRFHSNNQNFQFRVDCPPKNNSYLRPWRRNSGLYSFKCVILKLPIPQNWKFSPIWFSQISDAMNKIRKLNFEQPSRSWKLSELNLKGEVKPWVLKSMSLKLRRVFANFLVIAVSERSNAKKVSKLCSDYFVLWKLSIMTLAEITKTIALKEFDFKHIENSKLFINLRSTRTRKYWRKSEKSLLKTCLEVGKCWFELLWKKSIWQLGTTISFNFSTNLEI